MNMPLVQSLTFSLYQIGAIQFGEFKLKSGQLSPIYINLRKIISYPDLLRTIATTLWEKIRYCQFDYICGVPYTALPIATCISLEHHLPMVMRRKEKKDYGTKQIIEGEFKRGQRCLIIEDIITTGSSILETASDLEQAGLKVNDVVALIDREQGGKENLSKRYVPHSVLSLSAILHLLLDSKLLNAAEHKIVEQLLKERST
ncbi:MAG TPA: orotate phosphoribosyltransferase [Gammaproteobacteria bacterium]|nr:orotate phosphoribosyltransferase [Gammaproteobacteria bacterium]